MKRLLLLSALAFGAQAAIVEIVAPGLAESGVGIIGSGGFANNVTVTYRVDKYDNSDLPLALLGHTNDSYFRYEYLLSATGVNAKGFGSLIVGLTEGCADDPECVFGVETDAASYTLAEIKSYSEALGNSGPGLDPALYGIKFEEIPADTLSLTISFFSNRVVDPEGRMYVHGGQEYFLTTPGAVPTPNSHIVTGNDPGAVPEPMTMTMLASGLGALVILRNKFSSK
jgi:hypothetical protein